MRLIFALQLMLVVAVLVAISFWTQSNLAWLFHKPIPYWIAFITTIFCNGFILIADILVSLYRLVI